MWWTCPVVCRLPINPLHPPRLCVSVSLWFSLTCGGDELELESDLFVHTGDLSHLRNDNAKVSILDRAAGRSFQARLAGRSQRHVKRNLPGHIADRQVADSLERIALADRTAGRQADNAARGEGNELVL